MSAAATKSISPPERHPGGKKVQPDVPASEQDFSPTMVKRWRDQIAAKVRDRRMGLVLGQMNLEGILSEVETEAGLLYAADVGAYERSKGHPARHAQSPSFEFGRKGADGLDLDNLRRFDPEQAAKEELKIKRKRKRLQKRYDRAQSCIPLYPILIGTLVEQVCCNDRPIHSVHHPMLKKILRNLAERCYGLVRPGEGDDQAKKRRPMSRKADAIMIANAAVDALHHWFEGRHGTITSVNIKPRSITGHGHVSYSGEILAQTVEVKRSEYMAEAIHAQLIKAAEAKNWKIEPSKGRGE